MIKLIRGLRLEDLPMILLIVKSSRLYYSFCTVYGGDRGTTMWLQDSQGRPSRYQNSPLLET